MSAAPWELYTPARRRGLLAILFLVSLSNYADRQVVSVLIEPIKKEFGASDTMMGLLTGFAFAACYAVLGIPVARLSDRGDRRVVITVSLAIWSMMTVLCGFARSFWVLALARTGVGVGEAGAIPPAQSLIIDYFPPEQRARALSIFMASATVGYFVAFIGGAQIANAYGWRTAFIALGIPGLLLCAATWFGLVEPRATSRARGAAALSPVESVTQVFVALTRKRSFVLLNVSMVLYFLVAYGAMTWFPAYMVRVLSMKLTDVGAIYGVIVAFSTLVGTLLGGTVSDRLMRKDRRWTAWLPGIVLMLACPLYEIALLGQNEVLFFTVTGLGGAGLAASVPALFSALHMVCGSKRRATAVAIAFFFANLIGLGIGPVVTGMLSDMFTARFGTVGLGYALAVATLMLFPAGATLWLAGARLVQDSED